MADAPAETPAVSTPEASTAASPPPLDAGSSPASTPATDAAVETPETETVETPAPPRPATARDYAALEKAKFRAREAKREADAARAASVSELADLRTQLEAATKGSAEAAALREEIAQARKDGLRYAVKHGASADELIRTFVGETTPEKRIALLEEQLKAAPELAAKKAEELLAAERAARAKAEEEQRAANSTRVAAAQVEGFVRAITAAPEKTPYLIAEFTSEEIAQQARQIQDFARTVKRPDGTVGASYTYEEVQEFLERRAKATHDDRAARRAKLLVAAETVPGGDNGVAPRKGAPAATPAAGNGRRTAGPETRPSPAPKLTPLQQRTLEREEDLAKFAAARARDNVAKR